MGNGRGAHLCSRSVAAPRSVPPAGPFSRLTRRVHTEYDSWWTRRYYRRHVDAFARHCQDTTTGRSPLPAEILVPRVFILHDMAPRRHSAGTVRWMVTCHAGIFSRNSSLFWFIRVEQTTYVGLQYPASYCVSDSRYGFSPQELS